MNLPRFSEHKRKFQLERRLKLSDNLPKSLGNYYSFRALSVPVIFVVMVIAYLFFPRYAIFIPPFISLFMWGISKYYKKKLASTEKESD
ncbi:MAG: hypothetical protein ABIO77_08690 [Ginsengibacter sp.]